jgi:hypothetical protein
MLNLLRKRAGDAVVAAEAILYFMCSSIVMALPPRFALLPIVRSAVTGSGSSGDVREALKLWRVMDRVSHRLPWHALCLQRGLVLIWLLRRRGFQPQLRIGVRLHEQQLQAHAWVEFDHLPLGEPLDVGKAFSHFDSLPSPSLWLRREALV